MEIVKLVVSSHANIEVCSYTTDKDSASNIQNNSPVCYRSCSGSLCMLPSLTQTLQVLVQLVRGWRENGQKVALVTEK